MITETSKEILDFLRRKGHKLNTSEKNFIINKIYEAVKITPTLSWVEECGCGQMSCPICHG